MALPAEATASAVISQGSGRAQATAQSEVQWLGLEYSELGCRHSGHSGTGSRRRQRKVAQGFAGGKECEVTFWTPPPPPRFI